MTDQLIREFKRQITAITLVPSDRGRFEVSLDGTVVFSKLDAGRFPDYSEIHSELQARLKPR